MTFGAARAATVEQPEWPEIEASARALNREFEERWPSRGDVWELVGPGRIVSFLTTRPRHARAWLHYDAYWTALADHDIPAQLEAPLREIILALLEGGFSLPLELATRVAAKMWDASFAGAAALRLAAERDPLGRSAIDRFIWLVERRALGTNPDPMPAPAPQPELLDAVVELRSLIAAETQDVPYPFELLPPPSSGEVARLRAAVAPFTLPASLETWLTTTAGGTWSFWPGNVIGPDLPIEQSIDAYAMARDLEIPPGLLPIGYASHSWLLIELVSHREAALIDCPFGGEMRVLAPSLTSFIEATNACLRAGFMARHRDQGPWTNDPVRLEFDRIWDVATLREGWRSAPWSARSWLMRHHYLQEWNEP